MNCEYGGKPEVVELYVAGRLPDDEAARFELHYFECETCLTSVQMGQAIQGADTQAAKPKVISMPARSMGRPKWVYALAAAAALVLGTFIAWRALVVTPPAKTQ
ncbi:MAG TPA: zf-HC2 domain-containing protein, partial [Bryobacteraceae bacterium]